MFTIFLDTETTDKRPWKAQVIQIAAIAFEIKDGLWNEIDQYECKVQFNRNEADPEALEVNSYDHDVWIMNAKESLPALIEFNAWAQTFKDVTRFSQKTGKEYKMLSVSGHNVNAYDIPVLRNWYKEHKKFCPIDYQINFDTLELAKWKIYLEHDFELKPDNLKLETLCTYFGIPCDGAHEALNDTRMTARLAYKLVNYNLEVD